MDKDTETASNLAIAAGAADMLPLDMLAAVAEDIDGKSRNTCCAKGNGPIRPAVYTAENGPIEPAHLDRARCLYNGWE